jgi:dihydrofolate reductase
MWGGQVPWDDALAAQAAEEDEEEPAGECASFGWKCGQGCEAAGAKKNQAFDPQKQGKGSRQKQVSTRGSLISLVVAVAENGVIGREGGLPWHLPDDLKRFKALTIGKPILMGRRTFESIGRPLPGRLNLVLTRSSSWRHEGVVVVHSVDEALQRAGAATEICVIGGSGVFDLTLPLASRIYLTCVQAQVPGDTFFPVLDKQQWREVERIEHPSDARHAYKMIFSTLERIAQVSV